MKAEIRNDGFIWVTAETATEGYALKHLTANRGKHPVIFDCNVLTGGDHDRHTTSMQRGVEVHGGNQDMDEVSGD